MKKIKLIVSDFHLGKGRLLPDGSMNPLEDFFYDDKFIEFLKHYTSGEYENAEFELIINGDFFNLLQTEYVEGADVITEKKAVKIMDDILNGHPQVFDALSFIATRLNSTLTFVVGNHDQGLLWPGVEAVLRKRISSNIRIFPKNYYFDGVYVEHGNQYEVLHHFDEKHFAIRSALTEEPIQNLPWGSYFVINFLNRYKLERPYIDKIKPFRLYLRWAVIYDTKFAVRALPSMLWFYLIHRFHPDPARRRSFKVTWHNITESIAHNNIQNEAFRILKNNKYNTVIFGHTHIYAHKNIDGKEYLNTGTWNDLISLDISNFGRYSKLTYVFVDYSDSIPRCYLKVWRGYFRPEDDLVF